MKKCEFCDLNCQSCNLFLPDGEGNYYCYRRTAALLNHPLTGEQREAIPGEVIQLEGELKKLWGQVPPELDYEGVYTHLMPIMEWIYKFDPDIVICQGDFTAFAIILQQLDGFVPVYVATSKRESRETVQPDGTVLKTAVFSHVRFRRVI